MKFTENDLEKILKVEQLSFSNNTDLKSKFINPSKGLWIKKAKWPFNAYSLLSKVSGINSFPEKKLKYWLLMFLGKRKAKQVLGFFLRLPYFKTYDLPIIADVYFNKYNFGILLYINAITPRVLKFNLRNNLEYATKRLEDEIKSQKIANEIKHKSIYTPRLKSVFSADGLFGFEQELIHANDLGAFSSNRLREVFVEVFDFMFDFYKLSGVSLVSPKDNVFLGHDFVDNYLNQFDKGAELIETFTSILSKNKKVFWGRTHGDLSLNNILIDKNQKTWIIDWGKSKEQYLAKDLRNSNYEANDLYLKIVDHFGFEKESVYSLQEQIFIEDYVELSRLVHNEIVRKTNVLSSDRVNSSLKRLFEIEL